MNYIESVEIEGFWGSKKVFVKFSDDLNFLIGPNGSGKTTIINMISAALRGDIPELYAATFDKIRIKLKTIGANQKPIVEVHKTTDQTMGSLSIRYIIKEKSGDKGREYGVESPRDDRLYRDYRHPMARRHAELGARLGKILSDFVEVNWLSIHRARVENDRHARRGEDFDSPVDQKLNEITRAFAQYFSLLSSKAEQESKNFQEHVFLSLLDQNRTGSEVFNQANMESEDKQTVVGVLRDLGVSNAKAARSVNAHYTRVAAAKKQLSEENTVSLDDAIALSDAIRVSDLIRQWRDLQQRRDYIFKPRIKLEEIINSLFSGKNVYFDARNLPVVRLGDGTESDISVLSSGEEQLFILLGEALLQEERAVVFISDEPELSLHVRWQSSLFKNIRSLNDSCQVISATHSPDIVSVFQDKVIRIEDCIS